MLSVFPSEDRTQAFIRTLGARQSSGLYRRVVALGCRLAKSKCIFCGGTPVTREHVLPEWLGRVMAPEPRPGYEYRLQNNRGKDGMPTGAPWESKLPSIVTRKVCGPCNNGWMARIEEAAIPPISAMIADTPTQLNIAAQADVATWLALKAIIEQHGRSDPPPERWGREYYEERKPPKTWQVRIGRHIGQPWQAQITGVSIAARGPHPLLPNPSVEIQFPGFLSTLQAGHFVGQVIGLDQPANLVTNRLYWLQIWPHPLLRPNDGPAGTGSNPLLESWPPSRAFDSSLIRACTKDIQEPRMQFVGDPSAR